MKINSLVYEKLKLNFKVNYQCLQGINTFFARGLGPLAAMWDKILKWEAKLRGIDVTIVCHSSVMTLDNLMLDFTDLCRQFDSSLHLLCMGHCMVLDKRHQQLKSFFDPKFHYLLKASNPFTDKLLGDNIDQKVAESVKTSEAANKLQFMSRPQGRTFRGRSQCRSGNSQNYQGRKPFYRTAKDRLGQFGNNRFNQPQYSHGNYSNRAHSNCSRNRGGLNWSHFPHGRQ